jgi:hypothetical protein
MAVSERVGQALSHMSGFVMGNESFLRFFAIQIRATYWDCAAYPQ